MTFDQRTLIIQSRANPAFTQNLRKLLKHENRMHTSLLCLSTERFQQIWKRKFGKLIIFIYQLSLSLRCIE